MIGGLALLVRASKYSCFEEQKTFEEARVDAINAGSVPCMVVQYMTISERVDVAWSDLCTKYQSLWVMTLGADDNRWFQHFAKRAQQEGVECG